MSRHQTPYTACQDIQFTNSLSPQGDGKSEANDGSLSPVPSGVGERGERSSRQRGDGTIGSTMNYGDNVFGKSQYQSGRRESTQAPFQGISLSGPATVTEAVGDAGMRNRGAAGAARSAMYDTFKQVNRILKIINTQTSKSVI